MSPYIRKKSNDQHRCEGSGVVVWKGSTLEVPSRLWCPACGCETRSEITGSQEVTASVGWHVKNDALTWIRGHVKVFAGAVCVLVLLHLISTFKDQYFSVGGARSSVVLTRPITMLLGGGSIGHCISMDEDGQWNNKIEFVERSWWGIKENRYPMRFGRNYDYGEGIMMWEIRSGSLWEPFFRYPEYP